MGTIVMSGTVVLVILGFGNNLYWLAAVAVLFLYLRYGRDASAPSGGGGVGSSSGGSMPADYRSYRDRRDKQAKWERRYRRERPLQTRRQEREKSS
ncbi:hypothetical protein [Streptomyces sp. HD]|uniref:hypothetical protein n=1 Tax=Streptomyces sp. HD TaxID=3020892 RepID=UPI00232C6340|nr:hypothetical protein [Streptomyces sp. HD]MDC0773389.1 hypothetical protein [Streptomyces sp. HD]